MWDLIILYTREERSDRAVLATWPPGRRPVRFDPNHNEQFATMTQFTRLQELFNCIIVQMVVVQLTFLVYHRSIDYCLIGSWSTGKCRKCHLFNCQIVKLVFGQLNIGEMAVCSVVLLLNCPFVQFFTLFSQFLFNRPGSVISVLIDFPRAGGHNEAGDVGHGERERSLLDGEREVLRRL